MKTKTSKLAFYIVMFVTLMSSFNMAAQTQPQIGLVHYKGGYCSVSGSIIGENNSAFGLNSFAGGMNSTAGVEADSINSQLSFAFGFNAIAAGKFSVAMGNNAMAMKLNSVAIGSYVKANYQRSFVFGCGVKDHPLQINTKGIVMGVESYYPTFIITAGFNEETGRIGIGNVTEPQAKLHIKADSYSYGGEDADILLEPTKSDMHAAVYFRSKNNYVMMRTAADMDFKAERYNFLDGKISLGYINGNTPNANIHIFGKVGEDANIFLQPAENAMNAEILFRTTSNKISVGSDNTMSFAAGGFSFNSGKVGIGCDNNVEGFSLAVKDGIITEKVVIKTETEWPDFVFGKDYDLMSLPELKKYVAENQHLPNVPTETEVAENGVSVGDMQSLLLQKVEELTLYTIQQQEMMESQQEMINQLRQQCERQQQMIDQLMKK